MKNFEEIMNLKGSFDFGGEEEIIRNYISNTLKKVFEKYGYKPLTTSILCYYDLLALKYDEDNDILNEIYKVSDQGKRNLALRYDLTVPFAKYIACNQNIKLPYKRYEIGKVFRDGPVKKGRAREFVQCDVDSVGIEGQMIEAELVALYVEGFLSLGIEPVVKYNNRKLMIGLVKELNVKEEKDLSRIVTIIDKLEKLTFEEILEELNKIVSNKEKCIELLENLNLSFEEIKVKFENTNNLELKEGMEELSSLEEYIKKLNLEEYVQFSSSLARGQEYYTGSIFEVYTKDKSLSSSIGGGGRYDKMIGDFIGDGKKYPACGISFGLDAISSVLKNNMKKNNNLVYIIPMNNNIEALKIAQMLRKEDIIVDIEMNNKKLKKALDYANSEKIPYVIILGEDELKENKVIVKQMLENIQEKVEIKNLAKVLKEKIYFTNVNYKVYNPGGNKTALVENTNYTNEEKKKINDYILNKEKDVEQVGFVGIDSDGINYLEMAGKEFCINATRCAIYKILNGNPGKTKLKVSGAEDIIEGKIDEETKEVVVNLKINKKLENMVIEPQKDLKLVNLDGISLVVASEEWSRKYIKKLIENENLAKNEIKEFLKNLAENIVKEGKEISNEALGLILLENDDRKIKINPVIWVKSIDTVYYETSCGSGSIASCIYKYLETNKKDYEIFQVSGNFLKIKLDIDEENKIKKVIVSGNVEIDE